MVKIRGILLALLSLALAAPAAAAPPFGSVLEARHRNVVLQGWELSCAAGALATVLRFQYGEPVTERSVALGLVSRKEYIANPDFIRVRGGFSLLDMQRYAARLGYQGHGLGQLEFKDLIARAPLIVAVNLQGFPHFVVFRGATKGRVLLADPAFGNVTISKAKFMKAWIDYENLGHVGFVVMKQGRLAPPGQLSARAMEFVTLP